MKKPSSLSFFCGSLLALVLLSLPTTTRADIISQNDYSEQSGSNLWSGIFGFGLYPFYVAFEGDGSVVDTIIIRQMLQDDTECHELREGQPRPIHMLTGSSPTSWSGFVASFNSNELVECGVPMFFTYDDLNISTSPGTYYWFSSGTSEIYYAFGTADSDPVTDIFPCSASIPSNSGQGDCGEMTYPFALINQTPPPENNETRVVEVVAPTDGQMFSYGDPVYYEIDIWNGDPIIDTASVQIQNETLNLVINQPPFHILSTGLSTIYGTTTGSIPSGAYSINVIFSNAEEGYGLGEFDVRLFSVGATSTQDIVGINLNDPYSVLSSLGFSTSTCGLTSGEKLLACVIQGGLTLFWPSASSTEAILSIKDLITRKPPIGYFYAVTAQLEGISTTSTSTLSLPEMPQGLKDLVFNPVNAGIAAIIWWFFGVHFWHRLRDLDIL